MSNKFVTLALISLVLVISLYLLLGWSVPERSDPVEKITLGIAARESSGLVYIAERKGFFKKHGLEVSLKEFDTGLQAVNELLDAKLDVAAAAEFVFVTKSSRRSDLRIISNIDRVNDCECISRRDRGIEKPSDLKGKRIGIVPGMQAEFFFHAFLSSNGISPQDIEPVFLKPADVLKSISEGAIDATVTGLNTLDIKEALGNNALSWSAQGIQDYYFLLVSNEGFIKAHPAAIERLLKGLLDAEKLVAQNRWEAQEILKKSLKLTEAEESAIWDRNHYEVRLDQDILILMEEETRWAIRKGLIQDGQPNYFNMIHLQALEKVKREAVSVIH